MSRTDCYSSGDYCHREYMCPVHRYDPVPVRVVEHATPSRPMNEVALGATYGTRLGREAEAREIRQIISEMCPDPDSGAEYRARVLAMLDARLARHGTQAEDA